MSIITEATTRRLSLAELVDLFNRHNGDSLANRPIQRLVITEFAKRGLTLHQAFHEVYVASVAAAELVSA